MNQEFFNDEYEPEPEDLDSMTHEELKDLVINYQRYAEWLDDALLRCEDALHDTMLRAARVIPESAEEFFDEDLFVQARVRMNILQIKKQRDMN